MADISNNDSLIQNSTNRFKKGIAVINEFDNLKFEQFLLKIIPKVANQCAEIFTMEEIELLCGIFDTSEENLQLSVKTLVYLYKKIAKYVFMPNNLKDDLIKVGLSIEKSETLVKLWSNETKSILNNISSESDNFNVTWQLNAELSSVISKKSNASKLHMKISNTNNHDIEWEMTHSDLYSMFLQFEEIQNELDNIM